MTSGSLQCLSIVQITVDRDREVCPKGIQRCAAHCSAPVLRATVAPLAVAGGGVNFVEKHVQQPAVKQQHKHVCERAVQIESDIGGGGTRHIITVVWCDHPCGTIDVSCAIVSPTPVQPNLERFTNCDSCLNQSLSVVQLNIFNSSLGFHCSSATSGDLSS